MSCRHRRLVVPVLVLGLAACGGDTDRSPKAVATPPPVAATPTTVSAPRESSVKVVGIDVGAAIGPDKSITKPTTTFAPADTVHIAVRTEGVAQFVNVQARWHDPTNSVILVANQSTQTTGPATMEFHYSTLQGLAKGKWTVEVLVDGTVAGATTFEVE
jgi:hypothetical protein